MSLPTFIVARKELIDASRDRRSIATLVLTACFGPLMAGFMLNHQAAVAKSAEHVVVSVVGADRAPLLVDWLEQQQGIDVRPAPPYPESALRSGQTAIVLVIVDDFSERFRASRPAKVEVLADSTRPISVAAGQRVSTLLTSFANTVAIGRLVVRGVSPDVANPIDVRQRDVGTPGERAALVLNVVLIFLSLAVLTAGMQIATDSTAGERERRSMEPLLLNPVTRWQLVAGKYLAAVAWATAALVVTLLIVGEVLTRLPLDVLGIPVRTDASTGLLLFAAMLPLGLLAPAIQIHLGCFAKSFTEAQSYSAFLILPVAALGVLSILGNVATSLWMRAVPVLAQYVMAADVLGGRVPSTRDLLAAYSEALCVAFVYLWLSARFLSSDRMVMQGNGTR